MASAYGHRREYRGFVAPFDVDLASKVATYKQQVSNHNRDKIQALIDQYGSMDLVKDVDKEYFYDRLSKVTEFVNKNGTMDLSSDGVQRAIENNVRQAVDDNVLKAYSMSQLYRQGVAKINAIREKGEKGGYHIYNEMEAMEDANAWLNDGQVGSSFKGINYTMYSDVKGKLDAKMTELYKNSEQVIEEVTGDGRIIKRTLKGMSPEEVSVYSVGLLDEHDKVQMKINAKWGTLKQNPADVVNKSFTTSIDSSIASLQSQLDSVKDKTSTQAIKLSENINHLKNVRSQTAINPSDDDSLIQQKLIAQSTYLEQKGLVNGFQNMYRQREIKREYDTDQAYWNRTRLEFDSYWKQVEQQNNNRKYQLDLAKLEHDMWKDGVSPTGKGSGKSGSARGASSDPAIQGLTLGKDAMTVEEQEDVVNSFQNHYGNLVGSVDNNINAFSESLKSLDNGNSHFHNELNKRIEESVKQGHGRSYAKMLAVESMWKDLPKELKPVVGDSYRAYQKSRQNLQSYWDASDKRKEEGYKNLPSFLQSVGKELISDYDKQASNDPISANVTVAQNMLMSHMSSLNDTNRELLFKYIMSDGGRQSVDVKDLRLLSDKGRVMTSEDRNRLFDKYPKLNRLSSYVRYLGGTGTFDFAYKGSLSRSTGEDFMTSKGFTNYSKQALEDVLYIGGRRVVNFPSLTGDEFKRSPTYKMLSSIANGVLSGTSDLIVTTRSGENVSPEDLNEKLLDSVKKGLGGLLVDNKNNRFSWNVGGYKISGSLDRFVNFASESGNEEVLRLLQVNNGQSGIVHKTPDVNRTVPVQGVKNFKQDSNYNGTQAGLKLERMFGKELLSGGDSFKMSFQKTADLSLSDSELKGLGVSKDAFKQGLSVIVDRGLNGELKTTTTQDYDEYGQEFRRLTVSLVNGGDVSFSYDLNLDAMTEQQIDHLQDGLDYAPQVVIYDMIMDKLSSTESALELVPFMRRLGVNLSQSK